ncbi:hypothetical protein BVRB_6g139410 [Beta vulgaris subsp. vulgaris]|nr:hypothetical protein BVRB_6g139410 [Beta vulgaris subsp. vulgaris]
MEEQKKNSGTCRSWEEETYWKHFHFVHFFQILPTYFHHHLTLPTKFTANEIAKLPEVVILKGPNEIIWHVNLLKTDSNHVMITGDGWKEFVKAYSLQKKDLIIFKYDRASKCFEVLIFDPASSCEREASYFVRQHKQTQTGGFDGQAKSTSYEYVICSSDSTANTDEDRESGKDKSKQQKAEKVNVRTQKGVSTSVGASTIIREVPSNYATKRKAINAHGNPSIKARICSAARGRNRNKEVPLKKQSETRKSYKGPCYISNRRPVTESEKSKAFAMACKSATNESFIVIMRPSHVYKRFSLVIPRRWKVENFSRNTFQEVILRIQDKTWVVSFCATNNHGHGGFEGGWKKFALDNFLEEFDVCLFVPGGQENKSFVLDVNIFRVVNELTPLSPVN